MKGYHELEVTYKCTNCNVSFLSKTVKQHKSKFCSDECKYAFGFKDVKCGQCSLEFKVRKSKERLNYFCSKPCYCKHKRLNPKLYNIEEFTKAGQQHSNTPEAIEKGLKKKFDKGIIVDWKLNRDWKRFYKKCDALTRAMRGEMLKEWDGYDYYDGEYIKPYLELSVHHKNYPTLDHKHPRSKAFQDGLTPHEITVKENLVWTKRTNNSKKGNKTLNV